MMRVRSWLRMSVWVSVDRFRSVRVETWSARLRMPGFVVRIVLV